MQLSVNWHEDALNAAPEERATVGDLRWTIGGFEACAHNVGGRFEDHVTISLYGLAQGLAHDWWRIFGQRDGEISTLRYRDGFLLPDVRFLFDGAAFEIRSAPAYYETERTRFIWSPTELLDRTEAEKTLGGIIEMVLARLADRGLLRTGLARRWARVKESRLDPDEAAFCEAAGALGADPYDIGDNRAAILDRAMSLFSGEPLSEFIAGARRAVIPNLLDWVEAVRERPASQSALEELRSIAADAGDLAPRRPGEQAWALGYRRARAFRRVLGMTTADGFGSATELAGRLGSSSSFGPAGHVTGLRLLREDRSNGVHLHLRDHGSGNVPSHLFALARGVGDVACFREPGLAAVNDLHQAYRQAAGRAFAAELLAPVQEVVSMMDDGWDVSDVAQKFSVHDEVVWHQLDNEARIETACTE